MRCRVLRVLVSVALVATSFTVRADDDRLQAVMNTEVDGLIAQGYSFSAGALVEALSEREVRAIKIEMKAGVPYAFLGACDEPCSHVAIALHKDGAEIGRSDTVAPIASIGGALPADGIYELQVSPVTCKVGKCALAFAILEQPTAQQQAGPANAAPEPSAEAPQKSAEELMIEQLVAQLPSLVMTAIEAKRLRTMYPATPPPQTPVATSAASAPGKPQGYQPPPSPIAPAVRPQPSSTQQSAAECQSVAARYQAAARTAGDPASIANLINMYRFLQCRCGWPRSPHVTSC
jgi:hypothetical protein